jgi:flagellar biogenesis protein FliO
MTEADNSPKAAPAVANLYRHGLPLGLILLLILFLSLLI